MKTAKDNLSQLCTMPKGIWKESKQLQNRGIGQLCYTRIGHLRSMVLRQRY